MLLIILLIIVIIYGIYNLNNNTSITEKPYNNITITPGLPPNSSTITPGLPANQTNFIQNTTLLPTIVTQDYPYQGWYNIPYYYNTGNYLVNSGYLRTPINYRYLEQQHKLNKLHQKHK